jgi:hypothetical protein
VTASNITFPAQVVAERIRNLVPGDYMHLNSKFTRIEEVRIIHAPFTDYPELRNILFDGYGELAFMQFRADDVVLAVKASQGVQA